METSIYRAKTGLSFRHLGNLVSDKCACSLIQPTNASSDCRGRHDKDGKQDEHQLTNPKDENLSL